MLNEKQWAALMLGGALAALMVFFPPFFDAGGLFGGVRIAFVFTPPTPNYTIDFRPVIASQTLLLELSTVACSTLSAVLAVENGAGRSRLSALYGCALVGFSYVVALLAFSISAPGRGWLAAPLLFCVIPVQYPGGYFLFWLRLASLAFVTLLIISSLAMRRTGALQRGSALALGAASLVLLWIATTAAARR